MFLLLLLRSNPRHMSFSQWAKPNEYSVDHFGRLICVWLAAPKHLQSLPFGHEPPAAWQLQTHSITLQTAVRNTRTFSLFALTFLFFSQLMRLYCMHIFFLFPSFGNNKIPCFRFQGQMCLQNYLSFAPRGCIGLYTLIKVSLPLL